jgi:hypothetical protein
LSISTISLRFACSNVDQIPDGLVDRVDTLARGVSPTAANGTIHFPATGAEAAGGTAFKVEDRADGLGVLASGGERGFLGRERDFLPPASGAVVVIAGNAEF